MSYCVNCGVELDNSAKKCALCGTPVINPNKPNESDKAETTPFSNKSYVPAPINKRFIAFVISVIFIVPNLVCLLTNVVFSSGTYWAAYVNSTSMLLWISFVLPFLIKKPNPYALWGIDTASAVGYVYFIKLISKNVQSAEVFFSCALPIVITQAFFVLVFMLWLGKKRRHWVLKSIAALSDIGISFVVIFAFLDHVLKTGFLIYIGIIIFASCAVLIAFLIFCYVNKRVRRILQRKFFV